MLVALSSTPMQERLKKLIEIDFTREHASCHAYAESLHRDAVAAMIAMLLNLAVSAQPGESALPPSLTFAFISKQRKLPFIARQCAHQVNVPSGRPISLFQQNCTPLSGQHLQDWRDRLRSELESQSFYQRDSVVRSVAQICQDLEARCNTVEEPLRREQQKASELEEQVRQLSEQIISLESQAADDRFHLDGLEDENNDLGNENNRLLAKLEDLKTELSETNERGLEALRSAEKTFNARELELQSNILVHEEKHNAQTSELGELRSTISQLENSLEYSEGERHITGSRCEHLQTRLDTTERQFEEEQRNGQRQSEEIQRLDCQCKNLEDQLQSAESELELITGRLNNLQVSHQELIESSEEMLREVELKHAANVEVVVAKAEEEQNKLQTRLEEVYSDSHRITETCSKARKALQVLQDSKSELEARVQELTELCTEQEDELEELRTLRRNVLASMGLATPNPMTARSASRLQKDERNPETPREPHQQRRHKSPIQSQGHAPSVTTGTQGLGNTAAEDVDDPSLISSTGSEGGSTPKRRKSRPHYTAAASKTPFSQKSVPAARSASAKLSPTKRSFLRRMSSSRRHTTVGFAISEDDDEPELNEEPSSRKRRASLYEDEMDDSNVNEFLAGTPFTPGAFTAGTGRVPKDDEDTLTEL
jgi:chromosome segregation ATPase